VKSVIKCTVLLLVVGTLAAQAQVPYPNPIKHVIVVIQENRTPDNLFGANSPSNQYYIPGADLAPNNQGQAYNIVNGKKVVTNVPLISIPLASKYQSVGSVPKYDYDPSHSHSAFLAMCDYNHTTTCNMDGANHVTVVCDPNLPPGSNCPPANPQFAYVQYKDVAPYFQMASQYGYANAMFQTNQGESFTAHQFLFAGTSQAGQGAFPTWFVSEAPLLNGKQPSGIAVGCIAPTAAMAPPLGETVQLIDPNPPHKESKTMYPCFEHQTLGDLLSSPPSPFQPFSWKYYTPGPGSLWSAADAIQHICVPKMGTDGKLACTGSEYAAHIDLNPADVLKDIKSSGCVLPQVSWVVPSASMSDHAGSTTANGPSWVSGIVNAIGNNTTCDVTNGKTGYWYDTAIIITWDDWGGWYDHVPPPKLPAGAPAEAGSFEYGFRVPMVVISAYTPTGTISNVTNDFGSILKFVEDALGGLGPIDPSYADAFASNDLQEFFNFSMAPKRFQKVKAPVPAKVFIDSKAPLEGPDND